MIENAKNNNNPNTRWWILVFVSLLMFGNYYVYDAIGPLAEQLERELGFSDTQIGTLNAIMKPLIWLVTIYCMSLIQSAPMPVILSSLAWSGL